jgi:hypothetical protein
VTDLVYVSDVEIVLHENHKGHRKLDMLYENNFNQSALVSTKGRLIGIGVT